MNARTIELDGALVEEIINVASPWLERPVFAYDEGGDLAGLVYYETQAHTWYAATTASLRGLIETIQETSGEDSYSHWCAKCNPDADGETREAVLERMGWAA